MPAAAPESFGLIAVAVVKNGASAPLMHPEDRLRATIAITALGRMAPGHESCRGQ
jgi:hypothetical protein